LSPPPPPPPPLPLQTDIPRQSVGVFESSPAFPRRFPAVYDYDAVLTPSTQIRHDANYISEQLPAGLSKVQVSRDFHTTPLK